MLGRFADVASLSPPGRAGTPDAVREYLEAGQGEYAGVLGLFVCQASRLPELITELIKVRPEQPLPLSLSIDTDLGGLAKAVSISESRADLLSLRMVEAPAPPDVDDVWLERIAEFIPEDVVRVVEPRGGGHKWLDSVRRVAEHGSWPKLRCGRLRDDSSLSVEEVASFLDVIISLNGASFKATGGLNRAVRHTDPETGATHHGFLNLLIATARTLSGDDVREALAATDGRALADEAAALSEQAQHAVRGIFASCAWSSFAEGVEDLMRLGLYAPRVSYGNESTGGAAGA
ncbi:hypothetical protein [Amycolatopsis pigmentata]|uniref:Uncharacterized protein n=1 Tax=Amycolatopsis pigmentata TaxID=450801 RepID=A0ABW5FL91_9PSEU